MKSNPVKHHSRKVTPLSSSLTYHPYSMERRIRLERPSCLKGYSSTSHKSHKNESSASNNVSFNESVLVHPINRIVGMSRVDKKDLYYSVTDYETFKSEAQHALVNISLKKKKPAMSFKQYLSFILASEPSLRGLEAFVCPERIRSKDKVVSTILQRQRNLLDSPLPSHQRLKCLAEDYSKLSHQALMKAHETARSDYLEAYGQPHVLIDPCNQKANQKLLVKRQRHLAESSLPSNKRLKSV